MTVWLILFSAFAVLLVVSFLRPVNRFEDEIDDWRAISHRYNTNTSAEQQSPSFWPNMYPTPQQHYDFIREMYDRENRLLETESRNSRMMLVYFFIAIVAIYGLVKLGVI